MQKFVFVLRPDGTPLETPHGHARADLARLTKDHGYPEHTDEVLAKLRDLAYKEPRNHRIVSTTLTAPGRGKAVAHAYVLPEPTYRFLLRRWGGLEEPTPEAFIARLDQKAPPGFASHERAA